jgi:hypothetical protein
LSARPPDLDFWTGTRPRVVGVSPSIVPFVYSKRHGGDATSPGGFALSTIDRFVAVTVGDSDQPWQVELPPDRQRAGCPRLRNCLSESTVSYAH